MSNLTQFYQSGQGAFNTCQVFYKSGTWTPPPGVTRAMVLVWGGGGSGAVIQYDYLANGGAGGGFAQGLVSVTPGTGYAITIGAGGAYVSNSSSYGGTNGNAGGTSSFSTLLTATGGGGGYNGTSSTANGGSGSQSGTLWSYLATGGYTGYYQYGGGGAGSGSPYGDGGSNNNSSTFPRGSGGCGWSPNGQTLVGGSSAGSDSIAPSSSFAYGTGGSGLFGSGLGAGSGGGGSAVRGKSNIRTSIASNTSFNSWFSGGVWANESNPGGGQPSWPIFLYTGSGANNPYIAYATGSYTNNYGDYFDIVNKTLKGAGGHGWFWSTNGSGINLGNSGPSDQRPPMCGDGGAGSGGGGLYLFTNGGAYITTANWTAGSGGIGGGGGGITAYNAFGTFLGGYGGFGGGGGGACSQLSGSSSSYPTGGKGGAGGGGGGGAVNGSGASGLGTAYSGAGGDGCVMVFYRAT